MAKLREVLDEALSLQLPDVGRGGLGAIEIVNDVETLGYALRSSSSDIDDPCGTFAGHYIIARSGAACIAESRAIARFSSIIFGWGGGISPIPVAPPLAPDAARWSWAW